MIRAVRLVQHDVALAEPARDSRRTHTHRSSLLLALADGEGHVGLGEAAPLPGYSPDTLEDAWSSLAPLVGAGLGVAEPSFEALSATLARATAPVASPAARFALETALLDVCARRRGEPAWALLARLRADRERAAGSAPEVAASERCAVAALVPSDARALEAARAAVERGAAALKLKIGTRGAWARELDALRAIRRELGAVPLRADANQSLSPGELHERLPALRELELEWLEEPTLPSSGPGTAPFGVPLALDESLQTGAPDAAGARVRGVVAYVLKPGPLGGLLRALELARDARRAGIAAVVSHAFEGPVAFAAAAALALALGPGRPADGLGPHPALAGNELPPALRGLESGIARWSEPGLGIAQESLGSPATRELRA